MDIHGFLNSYIGNYMVQSVLHSLTAAALVAALIKLWKIDDPVIVQKFHGLVILLPSLLFPVYYLLNPIRGDASFRMYALFDSSRWLALALWGRLPAGLVLISLFIGASLVLAFTELITLTSEWVRAKTETYPVITDPRSPVKRILSELHAPLPDDYVSVIDNDDPVLFTTLLGAKPAIVVSLGLLKVLTYDQLKAALAHEVAHATRSRVFLSLLLLVRLLMFYNPVTFFAFKAASLDEEKICDDIAAFRTGKPQVLADTLKRFYKGEAAGNSPFVQSVAAYSDNTIIQTRIERLQRKANQQAGLPRLKFAITSLTIGIVNYYIV